MARPVRSDSSNVKTSTAQCSLIPPSKGTLSPAIFGTRSTIHSARHNPIIPAITLTLALSRTNSRTTLRRLAPKAIRNAISRRRPLKRTSNKFATLLQAIIKTAPTAISNVTKAGRKSPVTSSIALTSTDLQVQSAVSGCCAR